MRAEALMGVFSQYSKCTRIRHVPHSASTGLPDIPGAVAPAVHVKVGFLGRPAAAHLDLHVFGSGVVWYYCWCVIAGTAVLG